MCVNMALEGGSGLLFLHYSLMWFLFEDTPSPRRSYLFPILRGGRGFECSLGSRRGPINTLLPWTPFIDKTFVPLQVMKNVKEEDKCVCPR
jgi:hypothetical protein